MKFTILPILPLLSSLHQVTAWGTLGHETVAFIASNLVAPETKTFFQSILQDTKPTYLATVATWADSFRYTKAGAFSAGFHYIDAKDDPPNSCQVVFKRDCSGKAGCVVGAIGNYTTRLLDTSLSTSERNMAAKFLVHFLGDIHQPLHDESLDRGGNSIKVVFDGTETNLHHVWDTSIPEKLIGGYSLPLAKSWAAQLTSSITSGTYQDVAAGWVQDIKLEDPTDSALVWATESNALVCTVVLKDGTAGVEGQELAGDYYTGAVDVVQLQIAKAGVRLAKWFDLIAASVAAARGQINGDAAEEL